MHSSTCCSTASAGQDKDLPLTRSSSKPSSTPGSTQSSSLINVGCSLPAQLFLVLFLLLKEHHSKIYEVSPDPSCIASSSTAQVWQPPTRICSSKSRIFSSLSRMSASARFTSSWCLFALSRLVRVVSSLRRLSLICPDLSENERDCVHVRARACVRSEERRVGKEC